MYLLRNIFSIRAFFRNLLSFLLVCLIFLYSYSCSVNFLSYVFTFFFCSIKFDYITTSSILLISSNTLYVERIKIRENMIITYIYQSWTTHYRCPTLGYYNNGLLLELKRRWLVFRRVMIQFTRSVEHEHRAEESQNDCLWIVQLRSWWKSCLFCT